MGFSFLLDSGLHHDGAADAVTEAPLAAARDVDDAAPLVTAEGRLAATWTESPWGSELPAVATGVLRSLSRTRELGSWPLLRPG